MELTPVQQRVVGALAEKELTTPDNYPLSMNALLAACNQSTNRDPVMQLDERVVSNTLENLKSAGVVRVVYSKGMRVDKYRHVLPEAIGIDTPELALLTVLMLRGPQTGAELRTRTERMHDFGGQSAVEAALDAMSRRDPPLVALQPRQPGQKEPRWIHLLGPAPTTTDDSVPEGAGRWGPSGVPAGVSEGRSPERTNVIDPDRLAALEERVANLESRLDALDLD
ncbi:MAG: YceH family protein [Actinobacteria bacterium]|nr:YceH family protein [Actinomycetota bacterium]MBV9254823.1 YceH family protein [Actinomycetota bacterium]MBV9665372.1 YceH family protein [Actinomycetota bacterium]MBV9935605.1 YceH family protein [Actinomycetota bacterium]